MRKSILSVVAALAVVALVGVVVTSVASAQGPWWMEEDGNGVPPRVDPGFECPADCPYDGTPQARNFVDENDDGINDNAGQMGRWFDQDEDDFGPGMMGRWFDQNGDDFGPGMMGRWTENGGQFQMPCQTGDNFGPGTTGRMGRSFQNYNGGGMGRGWMMR